MCAYKKFFYWNRKTPGAFIGALKRKKKNQVAVCIKSPLFMKTEENTTKQIKLCSFSAPVLCLTAPPPAGWQWELVHREQRGHRLSGLPPHSPAPSHRHQQRAALLGLEPPGALCCGQNGQRNGESEVGWGAQTPRSAAASTQLPDASRWTVCCSIYLFIFSVLALFVEL